jgi:hypothetical protein
MEALERIFEERILEEKSREDFGIVVKNYSLNGVQLIRDPNGRESVSPLLYVVKIFTKGSVMSRIPTKTLLNFFNFLILKFRLLLNQNSVSNFYRFVERCFTILKYLMDLILKNFRLRYSYAFNQTTRE